RRRRAPDQLEPARQRGQHPARARPARRARVPARDLEGRVVSLLVTILAGAVAGGTSILWAALGETVSERAGVINVGTEGTMLIGALAAFATCVETGSAWLGVLAGAGAGAALAAVHAVVVVYRGASQLGT